MAESAALPPEEQDRVAAAIQPVLRQPLVTSDAVRSDVMAAFERVMDGSSAVLDYLKGYVVDGGSASDYLPNCR
jgi:hypothetical protein